MGIDEWAWRRGHRFGTIIVDLERHAVVELLAERSADSAAAWLRQQPGITTVVRDRSGLYADAASRGAPGATQIADRWYLVHNLAEGLEEALLQKRAALRAASAGPARRPGWRVTARPGHSPRAGRAVASSGPRR